MIWSLMFFAYLLGSLSFALIVSKLMGLKDPRTYGSSNPGATNIMRSGNTKAAILTFSGDFLKGLLVVVLARYILHQQHSYQALVALSGLLVVLGHIYPIFFKFKGGKGVATALGVILGFSPLTALLVIITWGIIFLIFRISSLSSLGAITLAPVYTFLLFGNNAYFGMILLISFFILYKHKSNLMRLLKATEPNFSADEKK